MTIYDSASEEKPIRELEEAFIPNWVLRLREYASQVAPKNYCGKVELNFLNGGVTSTNYMQSIR